MLPHWAMANAITSFGTLLAGVFTCTLWLVLRDQPLRWGHAYLWIFLTGVPTLGLHGYGEPFGEPSKPYWAVADTGSNLVLAWALQLAVLGDFYRRSVQWRVGLASGLVNLGAIGFMIAERFWWTERFYAVPLGSVGGFYTGEFVLILDSILVTALLYRNRTRLSASSRALLNVVAVTFLVGLALATAKNQHVTGRVLAYHALWHLVGAFGFMVLYLLNHIRFSHNRTAPPPEPATTTP
ncbi:MAG: hypothetical protein MJE66_09630 [Proteobacteria bacterium]|nr:hypothetical protein [Pseudomonadota bacterium]